MDKEVQCFFCEQTEKVNRFLRRYCGTVPCPNMPGKYSYHNAMSPIEAITLPVRETLPALSQPHDDERWPKQCACGYVFTPEDNWQVFVDRVRKRTDTGAEHSTRDIPPGGMWYAWWMSGVPDWLGPDGHALMVRLPDGRDWHVDSRANNCDSPCKNCGKPYVQHHQSGFECKDYVDAKPHKCWIRHGKPPKITVNKAGETCGAGAGSIQTPGWHGFLTKGVLRTC